MTAASEDTVLVTGAFGLVGRATVKQLVSEGRRVVATDLETPAYKKAAHKLPDGVEVRWADLTDDGQRERLLQTVAPTAIIHLVGMIAPAIYRNPALGRKLNVDLTRSLVATAESLPHPPRFVHASSVAVFGPRNPHRYPDLADVDTPTKPNDVYGVTKLEAEQVVRASALDWVILRLGAVVSTDLKSMLSNRDVILFESGLPTDGRVHTVDVRDVARAFAASTTADVVGDILMIGGDETHHLRYADAGHDLIAVVGLRGALPDGLPGKPDSEVDWFATDWMDTGPSQKALSFQHHSWQDILDEVGGKVGWKRHLLRPFAGVARTVLTRRSAYYGASITYADPWAVVRSRIGDPSPGVD